MKILVTNDDGYRAKGIKALVDILRPYGDILVVAPKYVQSGTAMGVTMGYKPIAVKELFYESDKLVESEVIPWMKENDYRFGFKKHLIYPDTANPAYNQMLERVGFKVGKTNKEVLAGINFIRGYHLRITGDSVNLIKEIRDYKWQTDRNGKETDEPVKVFDDAMDAMRYVIVSHLMKGTQTLAKPVCMTGSSFVWQ